MNIDQLIKNKNKDENELVRVIIQLNDDPAIKNSKDEKDIQLEQENVKREVEEITGESVKNNFTYLINGFSINIKRGDIEKLRKINNIKSITEAKIKYPTMKSSNEITKAFNVWKDYGYKGEGVVVSIIDTGIDYTHKDFKDINKDKIKLTKDKIKEKISKLNKGKHFTDKIPYGYNYADGNDDIIDKFNGMHGMHVAGIVAANGNDAEINTYKAIKGVAPEAQLLAMKVFSNNLESKSAFEDDIINAIEDSVKLGADIINISLGTDFGFTDQDDPEQQAIKNATEKGVLCVVASGNSQLSYNGKVFNTLNIRDIATVGNPGASEDALTVASSDNSKIFFNKFKYISSSGLEINDISFKANNGEFNILKEHNKIVYCGLGSDSDYNAKDVKDKIVVVKIGNLNLNNVIENAVLHGAKAIISINPEELGERPVIFKVKNEKIPFLSIGSNAGKSILNLLQNYDPKCSIEVNNDITIVDNATKDELSGISSWGPTPNLDLKPEISAPGGNIYSLANSNGYQYMSGTSMSSSNIAGAEALVIQSIKNRRLPIEGKQLVQFAKNSVINTAEVIMDKYNNTVPYSPRRQGAGIIQIDKAVKNNVIVTDENGKATVSLREIGIKKSFNLNLKNYGYKDIVYKVDKTPVYSETLESNVFVKEYTINGAYVSIDKNEVTVPAKGQASINITLNLPKEFEINNFAEGYIKFISTSKEQPNLSVPYMGFFGEWSRENIIDKPIYDKNSKLRNTGIGTCDLGDPTIISGDKDSAAFSPINGTIKSIEPFMYFLRNAKVLNVQILNQDKRVIRDIIKLKNIKKNDIQKFLNKEKLFTTIDNSKWDGTVYNQNTGQYDVVKDGQYYVRVSAKADTESSEEQIIDMPIKVDTIAPVLKIKELVKCENEDGKEKYLLKWTALDENSGLNNDSLFAYINGEFQRITNINYENEIYSGEVSNINDNAINMIQLSIADNATNIALADENLKVGIISNVSFANLSKGEILNKNSIVDGKFNIIGGVEDKVTKLIINGQEVKIEDGLFKFSYSVIEGKNTLKVEAKDKNSKTVFKDDYDFNVDMVAPEIKLTESSKLKNNEIVYVEESNLNIKGHVNDENLDSLSVINGENIYTKIDLDKDNNFSFDYYVKDGLNKLSILAIDKAGNNTRLNYKITKKSNDSNLKINFYNLPSFAILSKSATNDDIYTIMGLVTNTPKVFKINGKDVKINNNLVFKKDIKFKNGVNKIKVYAEDLNGNVIIDNISKIIYASKAPTISIYNISIRPDGNVYVNNECLRLTGKIKDNLNGYSFSINGDSILNVTKTENKVEKTFAKEFKLINDLTKIRFDLKDTSGNTTTEFFNIVLKKSVPNKPVLKLSEELTNKLVEVTLNCDETKLERMEYSFDNKNFINYTKPFKVEDSTKIYARVVDYAGNISDISENEVKIDTVLSVVKVKKVENGAIYNNKI